ncbi:hypothetical protein [Streptosporangium pseudovulgare]|uniref:Uncharacterized protein n=1 Tax=Streptosporangium pseudovulgare TaxID=35765 RepID=A0ABQ2RFM9_9ACTN|nr:hypothetical protein [Streptosporangium pseudovulgare]GGQ24102.1 hypothetical protein GCM10010140_63060 [Streptosporangium pseudovulgare]
MRLVIGAGVAAAFLAGPAVVAWPGATPVAGAPVPGTAAVPAPDPGASPNAGAGPAPGPSTSPSPSPSASASLSPSASVSPSAGPSPSASPSAGPSASATATATASASASATSTAYVRSRTDQTVFTPFTGGRNHIPRLLKKVPSLRVLPFDPRQASHVRVFAHCPKTANHALIGSTAFTLKGSRRIYREVGLSLSKRGLGHRATSISYYALPGFHEVCLKCVKVTMNLRTRIRHIRVVGRASVPLVVRRFSIWQFF